MKRILSLTLGFAALSLIGCPPPASPTPDGTGTAVGTGTSDVQSAAPVGSQKEKKDTLLDEIIEEVAPVADEDPFD